MRWPFRRGSGKKNAVPKEIQDYYQAERRERVGVAWLLALITLVVTVLLALGLFYGGRWAYRAVFDDNDQQTAEQNEAENGAQEGGETADEEDPAQDEDEAPQSDQPARLPGDDGAAEESDQPAPPRDTTPTTGPLPDTGPGDVVSVFVGTVIAATIIHHALTSRRQETRQ